MKSIEALVVTISLAGLIGTAVPALAQAPGPRTSFQDFGCVFDPGELEANGTVPAGTFEEGVAFVGFVTSKNCPGSQTQPVIQMSCEIPLDPDPGLSLSTRNFTCSISGAQCGFNQTFQGTNNRLDIATGFVDDFGNPVGRATIRCSRSVTQ